MTPESRFNLYGSIIRKAVCSAVLIAFTADILCFADSGACLAPWLGAERICIRRELVRTALERQGRIVYASSPEALERLKNKNADALLSADAKVLVDPRYISKGLNNGVPGPISARDAILDLKLLRLVIHEEIEAVMQVMAQKGPAGYAEVKNAFLGNKNITNLYSKNYGTVEGNRDLIFNDLIARVFEILILKHHKLVLENEISSGERSFIKAAEKIINAYKNSFFTGVFWNDDARLAEIKIAQANGFKFAEVNSSSAMPPELTIKTLREFIEAKAYAAGQDDKFPMEMPKGVIRLKANKLGYINLGSWVDGDGFIRQIYVHFGSDRTVECSLMSSRDFVKGYPYRRLLLKNNEEFLFVIRDTENGRFKVFEFTEKKQVLKALPFTERLFIKWLVRNKKFADPDTVMFIAALPQDLRPRYSVTCPKNSDFYSHSHGYWKGRTKRLVTAGWKPGETAEYTLVTASEICRQYPEAIRYLQGPDKLLLKATSKDRFFDKYYRIEHWFSNVARTAFRVYPDTGEARRPRNIEPAKRQIELIHFIKTNRFTDKNLCPVSGPFELIVESRENVDLGIRDNFPIFFRLRPLYPGDKVRISPVFLINPPLGAEKQWLLQVEVYHRENGRLALRPSRVVYYKFTNDPAHLKQIRLSPGHYIEAFARHKIYNDEKTEPFMGDSFYSTVKGNGFVRFGGRLSVVLHALPKGHKVRITKRFSPDGVWQIIIDTNHKKYGYRSFYYEFTPEGTLNRVSSLDTRAVQFMDFVKSEQYRDPGISPCESSFSIIAGGNNRVEITDEDDKTFRVVAQRLPEVEPGTVLTFNLTYLFNPPAGVDKQWILALEWEGEKHYTYYYRFSGTGYHLEKLEIEPFTYITAFDEAGIFNDPKKPPFVDFMFKRQVGANGRVLVGSRIWTAFKLLEKGEVVRVGRVFDKKINEWMLVIFSDSPLYSYKKRFFRFASNGKLKLYRGEVQDISGASTRLLGYDEIKYAQDILRDRPLKNNMISFTWHDPAALSYLLGVTSEHFMEQVKRINESRRSAGLEEIIVYKGRRPRGKKAGHEAPDAGKVPLPAAKGEGTEKHKTEITLKPVDFKVRIQELTEETDGFESALKELFGRWQIAPDTAEMSKIKELGQWYYSLSSRVSDTLSEITSEMDAKGGLAEEARAADHLWWNRLTGLFKRFLYELLMSIPAADISKKGALYIPEGFKKRPVKSEASLQKAVVPARKTVPADIGKGPSKAKPPETKPLPKDPRQEKVAECVKDSGITDPIELLWHIIDTKKDIELAVFFIQKIEESGIAGNISPRSRQSFETAKARLAQSGTAASAPPDNLGLRTDIRPPKGSMYEVFRYLSSDKITGAMTAEEISVNMGIAMGTLNKDIAALRRLFLLKREGRGKSAKFFISDEVRERRPWVLYQLRMFRGKALCPDAALCKKIYDGVLGSILQKPLELLEVSKLPQDDGKSDDEESGDIPKRQGKRSSFRPRSQCAEDRKRLKKIIETAEIENRPVPTLTELAKITGMKFLQVREDIDVIGMIDRVPFRENLTKEQLRLRKALTNYLMAQRDYNWDEHKGEIFGIQGKSLGFTDARGGIKLSPYPGFNPYSWNMLENPNGKWEIFIDNVTMQENLIELNVRLVKGGETKTQKFWISTNCTKVITRRDKKDGPGAEKEKTVQIITECPGKVTIEKLIKDPDVLLAAIMGKQIPDLAGLKIGTTDDSGQIAIVPLKWYKFNWPVLGKAESGWEMYIEKSRVYGHVLEIRIRFEKEGMIKHRNFQLSPHFKTEIEHSKISGHKIPVVSLGNVSGKKALGRRAVEYLITRGPDFDWEKEESNLPDVAGLYIGYPGDDGVATLEPIEEYHYAWSCLGTQKPGYLASIKKGWVENGRYNLTVRFSKDKKAFTRTFQVGKETRKIFKRKRVLRRKDKTLSGKKPGAEEILEITDRLGMLALQNILSGKHDTGGAYSPDNYPDLSGLKLKKTYKKGGINLYPAHQIPFYWNILGGCDDIKDKKGWKPEIVRSWVEDGYYRFEMAITKKNEKPVLKKFIISPFKRSLSHKRDEKDKKIFSYTILDIDTIRQLSSHIGEQAKASYYDFDTEHVQAVDSGPSAMSEVTGSEIFERFECLMGKLDPGMQEIAQRIALGESDDDIFLDGTPRETIEHVRRYLQDGLREYDERRDEPAPGRDPRDPGPVEIKTSEDAFRFLKRIRGKLKNSIWHEVSSLGRFFKITIPRKGEGVIIYADDAVRSGLIIDIEPSLKNRRIADCFSNGGKIVLYGRNDRNIETLYAIIKKAMPEAEVIKINYQELCASKNKASRSLAGEAKALVDMTKARGITNLLGLIRGKIDDPKAFSDVWEELRKENKEESVPALVIVGMENALYSFARAIREAARIKNEQGRKGWFIILPPIKLLSKEAERAYQEYRNSFAAMIAA